MDNWLDPLRAALDVAATPVQFFFRDDDAGWRDDRLDALLDLFGDHGVPIDLAVIPQALTPRLADALLARRTIHKTALGLHLHGFSHANYETAGRKCEFGASRRLAEQMMDIAAGQRRLQGLLGASVDPIFTPPWNRCTQDTVGCLSALGFETLSRNRGAASLELGPLRALDVAVDWLKQKNGVRHTPGKIGALLAAAAHERGPLGVMLHHAVMDEDDLRLLAELIGLLGRHPHAHCASMRGIADA